MESPREQHLFVMRHGDRMDDADPNWILTSPRPWDPPLTDKGKKRARRVGRRLRQEHWNITRIACSPFLRCVETASEVITALCALDPADDGPASEVAIDPSRVKAFIEFGLCEIMNTYTINVPTVPPAGSLTMDLNALEALLPQGTVDPVVPKIMLKLPDWQETLRASHKRYISTFCAVSDLFPTENVLCVTHGEGVCASVAQFPGTSVYQVKYCAISHLQRPVHPTVGPFNLLTESGDESGLVFSRRHL
ncbi:hypothetical protein KP509_37G004700 [Ceratopteris richardii]|uniref:Phosphoglycerate mutase family protein n=1 Tax=Ceratopteris richardii TaxID=49495 RepID=A0A8T2Q618_CERRI|nr:hypothetical protein KP509_37G004700 [Ceratopteris richardii]